MTMPVSATGPDEVRKRWNEQDYMGALSSAWGLGDLWTLPSWERGELTLGNLVMWACRQAVEAASPRQREAIDWVDELLARAAVPAALTAHQEDPSGVGTRRAVRAPTANRYRHDDASYRGELILAWLRATRAVIEQHWTTPEPAAGSLGRLASRYVPLGLVRDIVGVLRGPGPRPALGEPVRISALLVEQAPGPGVTATLVVEAVPDGSRALYASPHLAFLPDSRFRGGAAVAAGIVRRERLWPPGCDVRWRLEPLNEGRPPLLRDPSLSAALALAIAKLFVSSGAGQPS